MKTHPEDRLPPVGDEVREVVGRILFGGPIARDQLRLIAGICARSLYKDEFAEGSDWRVSEWRDRLVDHANDREPIEAVTFYSRTGIDRHCVAALVALGLHVVTSQPVHTRRRTFRAFVPGQAEPRFLDGDVHEGGWPMISLFQLHHHLQRGGVRALTDFVTELLRDFRPPPLHWKTDLDRCDTPPDNRMPSAVLNRR